MGLISGVVSLFGWDLPQLEWFHWRSVETRSCLRPFVVRVFIGAPNFWRFTVKWVWQRNSSYQTSSNLFCEDPTQPFRKPCWKRSERRHPQGGSCLPCLMNAAAAKENLIGKPLPETEIASPQLVILPLQLWSEDRHRHRQATNMYINIYIYSNYMYIHRYDVEHCETCFCFSALLAMMSFISLWRGSHMSATGMPAWWWTSVRHQWLSSYFMESSVGVLGGSWRDMMQQKSVPWLRTKRT